jgi:hypothetical protein
MRRRAAANPAEEATIITAAMSGHAQSDVDVGFWHKAEVPPAAVKANTGCAKYS